MDVFRVDLTEPAENDLRDIIRYISSRLDAPITALNMMKTIKEAIATLETMALTHPLVRDERLASMGYRSMPVKNYAIFYVVDEKEKTADVDRILYSRRDWKSIL